VHDRSGVTLIWPAIGLVVWRLACRAMPVLAWRGIGWLLS